jgi:hypothetical protein
MNNKLDAETLRIPAYMRKKMIVSQAKQKLILTALDRKEAGLKHDSVKPLAPQKGKLSPTPRAIGRTVTPKRNYPPVGKYAPSGAYAPTQLSFGEEAGPFMRIGEVTHYLDKIGVAIIMLSAPLKNGDRILVEGNGELFIQTVGEMQIDRKPVTKAKSGAHIGLKVQSPAMVNGRVYGMSA